MTQSRDKTALQRSKLLRRAAQEHRDQGSLEQNFRQKQAATRVRKKIRSLKRKIARKKREAADPNPMTQDALRIRNSIRNPTGASPERHPETPHQPGHPNARGDQDKARPRQR